MSYITLIPCSKIKNTPLQAVDYLSDNWRFRLVTFLTSWNTYILLSQALLGFSSLLLLSSAVKSHLLQESTCPKQNKQEFNFIKWIHCEQNNLFLAFDWWVMHIFNHGLLLGSGNSVLQHRGEKRSSLLGGIRHSLPTRKTWLALSLSVESSGLSTGVWLVNLESNWLASSADCCQKKRVS